MKKKFNLTKLLNAISYEPQLNLLAQMFDDESNKGIPTEKYHFDIEGRHYLIIENEYAKVAIGSDYNYIFLKQDKFGKMTGYFQRWGKTIEEDPKYSPIGPEILDIEISVNGCPNACSFCYKNNKNIPPTNMSLETFSDIIDKIPKTLTQVAFGITGVQTNPDFIPMMRYCRAVGIIPNFTLSGIDLTDELAKEISEVAGAIAVSAYQTDKNICYNTVKKFTDLGMNQINIHIMVSKETLPFVYEVLEDRKNDPRLAKMHAIVFLGVKPKGRAKDTHNPLSSEEYQELVNKALACGHAFGFDSCSAPKFEKSIDGMNLDPKVKESMIEASESCESSLFSSYINVYGEYWHCSFAEEEEGQNCVDVTMQQDFLSGVWYHPAVIEFRNRSIATLQNGCRNCTVFPMINC